MTFLRKFKLVCILILYSTVLPAAPLPAGVGQALRGPVEPGQVGQELAPRPIREQKGGVSLAPMMGAMRTSLPASVANMKFRLKKIQIDGPQGLLAPYEYLIGQTVCLGDIQEIANRMTIAYQQQGFVLTQVYLPEQTIRDGVVTLQIVSGFIDKIEIAGNVCPATRELLLWYANAIRCSGPLQMQNLEHYLLLANDIPGLRVRTILTPSKTRARAADLIFVAFEKNYDAYISVNNFSSQFLGPMQYIIGGDVFSMICPGDATNVQAVSSANEKLAFGEIRHSQLLTEEGLRMNLATRITHTRPGSFLSQFNVLGDNQAYGIDLNYPFIRSRAENLFFHLGFLALNSKSNFFGISLYNDHIRELYLGGLYHMTDCWWGDNHLEIDLAQGLPILNASRHINLSRPNGKAVFTLVRGSFYRLQGLPMIPSPFPFSLMVGAHGQGAFMPLLASTQFSYGGQEWGRAYDPAEITGDHGLGGTAELRMDMGTCTWVLENLQLYLFYDVGKVWNFAEDFITTLAPRSLSLSATGFGIRMQITRYATANFFIAKPLTLRTLEIPGRKVRGFFGITVAI